MPYTVALPDGRVVEFPDNVPPDKASEILRQQFPTPDAPAAPFSFGDVLSSFGRGAAGSTQALTNVLGADNALSGKLEDASKALEAGMTPARRAELQRQAERSKKAAESGSVWQEIKAAAQNVAEAPLQSAAEGIGSFVPYLPALLLGPAGAAIGLGARSMAAVNTVAKFAPRVIGTAQGMGSVKGSIYDAVYEAERKDGASEEEARSKAVKAQDYLGSNIDQIVLGGGLGYVAGSSGIERLLTPKGAQTAAPSMLRRVGKALAEEVPTEALQGGQEALAGNLALQRSGRDVPTFQGVAGQAAQEGMMAALSAGPIAAARSPASYLEEQERARKAAEQAAAARQAQEAAAQQAAFRQTPEYLSDVERRYAAFTAQMQTLNERASNKVTKNEDPAGYAEREAAIAERRELLQNSAELIEEFRQAKPFIARQRAQQAEQAARAEAMQAPGAQPDLFGQEVAQTDMTPLAQAKQLFPQVQTLQKEYDAAIKAGDLRQAQLVENKLAPMRQQMQSLVPSIDDLNDASTRIKEFMDASRTKLQALQSSDAPTADKLREAQRLTQLENALKDLQQITPFAAPTQRGETVEKTLSDISKLRKKAQKAIDLGENPQKLLEQLAELEQQGTLFSDENYAALHAQAEGLGQAIGEERERRAAQQKLVEMETEALRRIAARGPKTEVEQAIAQQKLEQARADMARLTRERTLRERLATLDPESDEAKRIQARLDELAPPIAQRELSPDRLKLVQELEAEIRKLEAERKASPIAGEQGALFAAPEGGLDDQIAAKKQALGEVQKRVDAGDRYRDTTEVGDNILADARDSKVNEILDQLLPKALTKPQEGFDKMNERGALVAQQREAEEKQRKALDDLIFMYRNGIDTEQDRAFAISAKAKYISGATAAVESSRELANGIKLTPEALGEMKRQFAGVAELLVTPVELRSDEERKNPAGFLQAVEERNRRIVDRFKQVIADDTSGARRVRKEGLVGQEVLQQMQNNQRLLAAVSENLRKAGNPKDPAKIEARNVLVGLRDQLKAEQRALQESYNRTAATMQVAPEEDTEAAQMRQQLAAVERQLKSLTVTNESGNIRQQLEFARDELKAKIEASVGPSKSEQADDQTKNLPGFGQLFGRFQFKATDPADLTNARTAFVNAETRVEQLRKAIQKSSAGPKYFTEVATRIQNEIDAFAAELMRDPGNIVLQRAAPAYEEKRKDVIRFENLSRIAATGADLAPRLQAALTQAQADVEKKRAALEALETRQRQYEQQEAAKQGRTMSEVEQRKVQQGQSTGYVTPKGKPLTATPRKLQSWDISKQSVAKVPEVPKQVAAAAALQKAQLLLARLTNTSRRAALDARQGTAATAEELTALQKTVGELDAALKANFTDAQAQAFVDEIARLNVALGSDGKKAADKIEKQYAATKTAANARNALYTLAGDLVSKAKEAEVELRNLQQQVAAAETKYNAARKAIDDMGADAPPVQFAVNQNRMTQADTTIGALEPKLKKAEQAYLEARRDLMLAQYTLGTDLRNQYMAQTRALAERSAGVEALVKQAEEAKAAQVKAEQLLEKAQQKAVDLEQKRLAERNAAKIKEEQAARDAAENARAERERLEQAKRGEGIEGVRYERDTAGVLMTAAQNDFKRQIAEAETNLTKALNDGDKEQAAKLQKQIDKLNADLDGIYGRAPVTVTDVNKDEKPAAVTPEEGRRLRPRKEGPLVRNLSGSKKMQQSGQIRLRANGLSQEAANAVALHNYSVQVAAAKTDAKRGALQAKFDRAAQGLTPEQLKAQIALGAELSKLGPSLEVIAKRLQFREAVEAESRAQTDYSNTKDPDLKALLESEVDEAKKRSDAAERSYKLALERHAEKSKIKKAKPVAQEIADELDDTPEEVPGSRTASAIDEADEDLFGTTYANMSISPADAATLDLLQDGQLSAALDRIAKEGSNDLLRRNAAAISKFAFRTKVVIQPGLTLDGKPVPAYYSPTENTVYLNADTQIMQEDVVHEATHAVTLYAMGLPPSQLTKEQQVAKNELMAMWRTLSKDKALADQYGMTSLAEFASEMQSNAEFRKAIGDRQWRGGSFLRRAFNLLLELVGLRRAELLTDKAEKYISDLYMQSRRMGGKKVATASRGSVLVADDESRYGSVKANLFGLGGRVQYVDRLGAADEAFVRAQKDGKLSSLEAENAQYFMRLADQVTQAAGQFITSGPVRFVKDKFGVNVEERYEASTGANLINVAQAVEDAAKAGLGSAQEVETILTVLVAGDRANATPSGWQRLAAGNAASAKAEYDAYKLRVDANPQAKKFIEQAKAEYKKYNDGLIDFIEQSGFLGKKEADNLRSKPYVPFYRVVKDEVRLYVDSANWVRIGDLKTNPDLQQFVGSGEKIMPILTSSVQNTFMLTRAAMQNKGTHETANALFKAGFASKFGPGMGPDSPDVVRFKVKGQDYFAMIDSDAFGIPANLIVRGMEGMKVATPEIVKMMGIPANWVRKFVTRSPAYIFRQLVREPIQAAIMQGVDGVPVLNALQQMAKMRAGRSPAEDALMRGLVVSSNIYTGDEQDMQMFLRDISTGKGKWDKLLGTLDSVALQADAATRASLYEDSLKKGLTPRQAQFRALEAQNFSRRGLSPSMQMMRTMVPFFNAQIQGLDVLYRAMRGRLPFEEKLKLRDKMIKRGLLLAVTAFAYAMAMREDEKYMELPPEVRYGNFLFKMPGGTDYVKVPIPYELGIIFKALPEALLDAAMNDTTATEAAKGVGKLLWQSAPGVVPVAVKPWVEASLNQTAFGPIEDRRMQGLPAEQRYREETPEVLKSLGSLTGSVGLSPRMLEHFASTYGSSLLLSILRIPDGLMRDPAEGERASTPISKTAFVGGMFQSEEGRFAIDRAYAEMEKINQAVQGYEDLVKRGRRAEADAFAQRNSERLDAGSMAGTFRQRMGEMFKAEREIRQSPDLTAAQKDAMIKEIKESQQREAKEFYAAVAQTKRQ